jgi:signal transduction histidine kinase
LINYENGKVTIPKDQPKLTTGPLSPIGQISGKERYSALIMPLSLARNRFGFMWVEVDSHDWEIYLRIRNLISSVMLRIMLVQQREQAQHEVERLLEEARQRAADLSVARDEAEKTAKENALLYEKEQSHRRAMELLARASRQLSSLVKEEQVPQQVLEELSTILQFDRGIVFLEDVNGVPRAIAQRGMPEGASLKNLRYLIQREDGDIANMYDSVARMKESIHIGDTSTLKGWIQPEEVPADQSWLGVPLYFKNKVMGMVVVMRNKAWSYTRDDVSIASAFAVQAAIALENARLYDEVTNFGHVMERMVEQRVDELNKALGTLEKLDKTKSAFIQVAAHELRTPLTVIKGYLGMFKADESIKHNPTLGQAVDGVMQGVDRLHQIVNSMLDVARLENQTVTPRVDMMPLGPTLRLIQKDYAADLAERNLTMTLDDSIKELPALAADSQLMQKALDQIVVNAIKFTPDGGTITVSAQVVKDERMGDCAEIQIKDTGIGINRENHTVIFEKLYQLGKVEFHSSSRTNYKGGGPGLGLAIAAGIIKAHGGKIWVESQGHNEETFPGSTFFIRIPFYK